MKLQNYLLLSLSLAHTVLASESLEAMFVNPLAKRATVDHLGRRDVSKNGLPYPEPGTKVPTAMPPAWLAKLKKVEVAGLIPKVPVSTSDNETGLVSYPSGVSASEVCSWTNVQCIPKGTISDAPDQTLGLALDDGPVTAAVKALLPMIKSHNVSMSHFLIGSQILWDLPALHTLAKMSPPQHLAIHTFTHTMMTTHTNEEIVADLGWAMQLIYDYTGLLCAYWRPPSGDIDNRVYAVAKEVFGLQLVMWNHDTVDWCLLDDGTTYAKSEECRGVTKESIRAKIEKWTESREGVLPLMHEARVSSLNVIKAMIEAASNAKYAYGPVPFLQSLPWYSNSDSASTMPKAQKNILPTRPPFNITDTGSSKDGAKLVSPWHNVNTAGTEGVPDQHFGGSSDASDSGAEKKSSSMPSAHDATKQTQSNTTAADVQGTNTTVVGTNSTTDSTTTMVPPAKAGASQTGQRNFVLEYVSTAVLLLALCAM